MKHLLLFALLLFFLGSCRPELSNTVGPLTGTDSLTTAAKEDNTPSTKPAGFRLIETRYRTSAGVSATSYRYNAFGRLLEITSGPTGIASQTTFRWLNDQVLRTEQYYTNPPWSSSIQQNLPLKLMSFSDTEYDSDGLIKTVKNYLVQDGKNDYRSYLTYEYDANRRITRKNVYSRDNKLSSYNTYTYDARGNVLKDRYYGNWEGTIQLISTETYEYDNKPNPLATTGRNYIIMDRNPNNIVRKTYVREFDVAGVPRTTDERWSYTYRADGYPSHMLYKDGSREEFVYNR